jgi:hypothetical protein
MRGPGFTDAVKGTSGPGCILMYEVAKGDNTDKVSVVANHWHAADAHASHSLKDFVASFIGTASLDVNRHGIRTFPAVWCRTQRRRTDGDVAVGNDSDNGLPVTDGQSAHAVIGHQLGGAVDRGVWLDATSWEGHDFGDFAIEHVLPRDVGGAGCESVRKKRAGPA